MSSKKTKKRRIDVMLSSTRKDLDEHRKKADDAIRRARWTPIAMEYDEAIPGKNALSYSLGLVDEAEVYLGIFGVRYGFKPLDPVNNPKNLSITELEYRRAKERSIPLLIFVMDMDNHHIPASFTVGETDEDREKLKLLKDELTAEHIVSFFASPEELRTKAYQSLVQLQQSGVFDEEDETEEEDTSTPTPPEKAALPVPPEFYADPPYTLTSEFVGRTDELRRLDAWATGNDPMMIVEAIGGMGKSAVTWEWVQNHAKKHKFDGILWWSFYESGANMAAFVRHALAYVTRQDPDALKTNGMKENFRDLLQELRKGRYLLVLDGLERTLVAYHRWNAAQMRDDTVEDAESIVKDRDIRACTDPRDDDVLRGLLACEKTRVLISSRLLPLALEDRTGNLSKGAAHVHLNGLHPDDALALTRAAGVTVDDVRQFQGFMKQFGYHSLLVKLVAGRVLKFKRARGDFDRWYVVEGRNLHVSDFDLRQSQTHILQYALDGLDDGQRRFLSQIAAFGDAVPYGTLAVFNPYAKPAPEVVQEPDLWFEKRRRDRAETEEDRQYYQQQIDERSTPYTAYLKAKAVHDAYLKSPEYLKALSQFDELLTELEERGLLRWERDKDTYDMHPVVRGTAFDELEGETKTATFERIRGHFEAQKPEDIENAQTVADLTNTIAIYRALVGAGKWDEAARFFNNRLMVRLKDNIAAYYTVIELLTPLFPDGTDTLPRLSDSAYQGHIVNTLAGIFYYIGRIKEALALYGLALKVWLDSDDLGNLIIGLQNYSTSLRDDNQLTLSQRVLATALALAQTTDNQSEITYSTLYLLGIYKETGQWEQAEAAYAFLQEHPPREVFWRADIEKYYAETLIYRGVDANAALGRAESFAIQSNHANIYRQIKGLRGEVALAAGDFAAAARYFEEALTLARIHGSADATTFLGRIARIYAKQNERDHALKYIDEALSQPMKEETHDLYSSVAETYLITGERDTAREYALKAYEWAWADGPPYIWWWHLERAKAVLDALGVPYPDMPPFDESKIGKFIYQDEIEAILLREKAKRAAEKDKGEG